MTTNFIHRPVSHENCLLCGDRNRYGLRLRFYAISDSEVETVLNSNHHHQGYEGILHGGFVASLMDSAMCNVLFYRGIEAVTGDMSIRYFEEIPYACEVLLRGKFISGSAPLYKVESMLLRDDRMVVSAQARFVQRGYGK